MTFPIVKDKRLLLKIVVETKRAIALCINSILQYEYLHKRIELKKEPEFNFRTFKEKSSKRYLISGEEVEKISELFEIVKNHENSSMEFLKEDEIIILSDKMEKRTLTIEKTKEFLQLSKDLLNKAKLQFFRKI
jgi:hypothetical protein